MVIYTVVYGYWDDQYIYSAHLRKSRALNTAKSLFTQPYKESDLGPPFYWYAEGPLDNLRVGYVGVIPTKLKC